MYSITPFLPKEENQCFWGSLHEIFPARRVGQYRHGGACAACGLLPGAWHKQYRLYPTDILSLSHDELRLRSNNPGGSVEILLVPARVAPLPP